MTTVISCPSCGKRLRLDPSLPPDSLAACPACKTEFSLSAASSSAGEAKEEKHQREVGRDERVASLSPYDEEPTRPDAEDKDDELLSMIRRRPARRRLWLGAAALLLLVLLVVVVVWIIQSGPGVQLAGSWQGKFEFVQFDVPCTYEFHPNGAFVDEHVDPATGALVRFPGRYRVSGAEVTIQWPNGGFERAHVRTTGPDTIEYTILAHSDLDQVGAKVTFVRVKR